MIRNVPTYALWPVRHGPRGYVYLWACGHEDVMPHRCPKGPDRATLFEAPDLRRGRPAWFAADRFNSRHGITDEWSADEARDFARRRLNGRTVA